MTIRHLAVLFPLVLASCGERTATDSGSSGSGEIEAASWSYNLITQSVDFGSTEYGETVSEVIVLQNNGDSDLYFVDFEASGAAGLSITAPSAPVLSRGDVANIVVEWSPTGVGDMSSDVRFVLGPSPNDTEEVVIPVTGSSTGATVVISTQSYDFGDLNVGCSDELTVTVTNTGNDGVLVNSVHIDGNEAITADTGDTEFPVELAPFQSLGVDVGYSPTHADGDQAYLTVETEAGTVASAIEGRGAVDGEESLIYEVGITQRASVIWHVNEVALPNVSWGYYHEPFFAALPHYFETLKASRAHYRIAFTWNTDGSVEGDTPYIDHTMSVEEAMTVANEMMASGSTIGDNDRNFTSLISALEKQQDWLSEDEYWEESKLSLITVQRDVEQSGGNYVTHLANAQAYKDDSENLVFHAIAGPPPSGCGYAEYFSGYYEAVVATDGLFLSVCEEDWDAHMEKLVAASIGGGGDYFPLSGNPLESTIEVYLDGSRSSDGWEYDGDLNSIIFEDESYPLEGTEVRIDYIKATGCG